MTVDAVPRAGARLPGDRLAVSAVEWWGRQPYDIALERQRALHAAVVDGSRPDTLILVEHDAVYTAGRRTTDDERPSSPGAPVVDVDRGGKITWHGPGQLVGYPIVRLAEPLDVVAHVRRIESLVMAACADLGVATQRVEGRSGVWTDNGSAVPAKVAAVGVRVARGVTMHGFAINADCDLASFGTIVPCGIADAGVTSLSAELGRDVTIEATRSAVLAALGPVGTEGES